MDTAQIAVNQAKAVKSGVLVSSWRPFIGWSWGVSLCYALIFQLFLQFALVVVGVQMDSKLHPVLDLSDMLPGFIRYAGLGGMRTFEKVKGASDVTD
ncbi:MAG: hypothetical protein KGI54_16225 [Pseudomonadota bacterium]|nr:hypothetical protein [Pseudomonadota bacterium]